MHYKNDLNYDWSSGLWAVVIVLSIIGVGYIVGTMLLESMELYQLIEVFGG